jgi:LPS export ABC transporter permease LptG/LPS export ABC transporter permease LptF
MRLVLDRMVIREVVPPSLMGFAVYTFFLLMRGLFSLMEQVFVRGVDAADAFRILLISLPHVVVLTIPMAFLFGVLIAMGRLNSDNEIVALQAAGIPARRLLRAVVLLGTALFALNSWIALDVLPRSNREMRELKTAVFTGAKNLGRIEPRVFYEEFPNLLVYVEDVDPETSVWRNVLVYDTSSEEAERLILARRGRIVSPGATHTSDQGNGSSDPWLRLEEVVTHHIDRRKPETYRTTDTAEQRVRPRLTSQGSTRVDLGVRERSTQELWTFLQGGELPGSRSAGDPERRRTLELQAALELQQRLAIPAASLVFGLLAVPLGIGSRSGGRGRGFVLSLVVVLLYYIMLNNGEIQALEGRIPAWLGMWLPNLVLGVAALFLIRRMGRWLGERQGRENPVHKIRSWWRRRNARRRSARGARREQAEGLTGSIPVALQRRRYGAGFPTMLDRYVTQRLVAPILFVLLSTVSLYIIVDLTDHLDEMATNKPSAEVVIGYYWNLVPQAAMDVLPLALMIGVLILLTVLERQLELTALKAAGVSLYRLVVPVLLVGALGVAAMWLLGESVVPQANSRASKLLDRIEGRETARTYLATDRQWLVSRDESSFYNFLRYDEEDQAIMRFTMFTIDDRMRLRFHLVAPRLLYRDGAWIADAGWFRQIESDGSDRFQKVETPMEVNVPEGPGYFGQEYRRPSEMTAGDLYRYIEALRESGYQPDRLSVRWHQKFAYPLSAFIMVLLSLPYGLNRGGRRVTTMQSVAIALSVGIGYFVLVAAFGKMAEAGLLHPIVGAWGPVVLSMLYALNRLTVLRT